jgi:hypothetical protein
MVFKATVISGQTENKDGYLHPSLSKGAEQEPVIKEQTRVSIS